MERKSGTWWVCSVALFIAALSWKNGLLFHLDSKQTSLKHVEGLKWQAQHSNHLAVQHFLHAWIANVKATSLQREAVQYEQKVQSEDLELLQEEDLVKEYKDLYQQAQDAIRECQEQLQHDKAEATQAHEQARSFLDDMYSMEHEWAQTCAKYRVTDALCDTVARFNGVDDKEQSLALNALSKEEEAYAAEERENEDEQEELQLEKNATILKQELKDAEHNVTLLQDEHYEDQEVEDDLEGNATALFHESKVERAMANESKLQAQAQQLQVNGVAESVVFHTRRARCCAVFSLFATIAVLHVFGKYLVVLLNTRTGKDEPSIHGSDGVKTVWIASSMATSEESPLVVDQQAAASEVEIASIDDTYSTIDLQSRDTAISSLSPSSSHDDISRFGQRVRAWWQRTKPRIQPWLPTIELASVVLVLMVAIKVLALDLLPNLHKL